MKKNVGSQVIGAQLISKTDGSAVTTGTTTIYVTGDGGTQATGSVGSGACTHEGNGYWTYAPAQGETNYDQIGFTFVNTSACNVSVSVYPTFPQTGDSFARLGAPAGASVSADVAAVKTETAGIQSDTNDIQTRLPAALVSGRIDASVGAMAANVITAAATAADFTTEVTSGLAQEATLATVAGYLDTEIAAIKAVTDVLPNAGALTTIQSDLDNIQARIPAALISGRMDVTLTAIGDDTTALTAFKRAVLGNVVGTCDAGSTTTSIVTSALTPAGGAADQFKGRIITFSKDTTTAALRGQATDITASTNAATPTFTCTALTTAPASGDTFAIT